MGKRKRPKPPAVREPAQTAAQSQDPNPIAQIIAATSGATPVAERVNQVVRKETATRFEGPIPHPEIFRMYGDVIPDAPERILKVFEEDSKHAREIQVAALSAQKADNKRVHWMAYSLIAGGYILSAVFAALDKDTLAGIILATTLAGTITGFLQQRKEAKPTEQSKK